MRNPALHKRRPGPETAADEHVLDTRGPQTNYALILENISKTYRSWSSPFARFTYTALDYFSHHRPGSRRVHALRNRVGNRHSNQFSALRGVTFRVKPGESLGIIGRNGAGKSTLLQILAGTLLPSDGHFTVNGRLAALLELGAGFNPEFTGRENVYFSAALLGIRRREVTARFAEIVKFADIGDFLDKPVKTYSKGMLMRLAFSVQVMLNPSVLLIDEILAVGDIFFRQKCFAHMNKLKAQGTAIILVSHDLGAVCRFCDRAILLSAGNQVLTGNPDTVAKQYQVGENKRLSKGRKMPIPSVKMAHNVTNAPDSQRQAPQASTVWDNGLSFRQVGREEQVSNGWAHCSRVAVCDINDEPCTVFEQGDTARFYYEITVHEELEIASAGVGIQDTTGHLIHVKHALQENIELAPRLVRGTVLRYCQEIALELAQGQYTFDIGFLSITRESYSNGRIGAEQFERGKTLIFQTHQLGSFHVIPLRNYSGMHITHWGLVNLPGKIRFSIITPEDESAEKKLAYAAKPQ